MAVLKTSGVNNTTVEQKPATQTFFAKIGDAVQAPFMAEGEVMTADGVLVTALTWAVAGSLAGGMFARRRAEAGEEAFFGFAY